MSPWRSLACLMMVAACAPPSGGLPPAPVAAGAGVVIVAEAVPLDPTDPAHVGVGDFTYAGGLVLTSRQTGRLHGLSDLKVWPDGRLLAIGDQSDLLEARLKLDGAGRLVGLTDIRLTALKDERGVDLYAGGQREFDSEGIAELANGDRLISFEQHDRVLLYPKSGGGPRPAPFPRVDYVLNKGMEALVADPAAGPDAYRVGIEKSGQTFLCRLSSGCVPGPSVELEDLTLAGMELLPAGRTAYLLRDFFPLRGTVVRLKIVDAGGRPVDEMQLARPLTTDNFEGVAAVPGPAGRIRFYLVSDDNFGVYNGLPTNQRTLLLAFDWTGSTARRP